MQSFYWSQNYTTAASAAITYGEFSLVGANSTWKIRYSNNGSTFTASTGATANNWDGVDYLPFTTTTGVYVATSAGSLQSYRFNYSNDAKTWTTIADPVNSISGNSRRYCAVAATGSHNRMYISGYRNIIMSTTGGSFSQIYTDATTNYIGANQTAGCFGPGIDKVCFLGSGSQSNNLWVGSMSGGASSFGIPTVSTLLNGDAGGVGYVGGSINKFIVMCGVHDAYVSSSDGITWTPHGSPGMLPLGGNTFAISWSPALDLIVVGVHSGVARTTPFYWATASAGPTYSFVACNAMTSNDYGINSMVWAPEKSMFVATEQRKAQTYTSTDGKTWTIFSAASTQTKVAWGPGIA